MVTEKVSQRYFVKKRFLKILQNLQKNTSARVSFLMKLLAKALALVFSCQFCEYSKNTFFTEKL